jgi:hypothetical protein
VGEIMPIKCKKLDIINRSMLLIKKSPITDLDEDSEVASYVRFLYPVVKAEIIESYPFACAKSFKNLISVHGGDNNKEYKYKFILPMDFLKLISISVDSYSKDGIYLYCDSKNVKIKYLANIDEELFTVDLAKLVAYKLAIELSLSLNVETNLISQLQNIYDKEYAMVVSSEFKEANLNNYTGNTLWVDL